MNFLFMPSGGPFTGMLPATLDGTCTAKAAFSIGEVGSLDMFTADGDTDTLTPGETLADTPTDTESAWSNVINPSAAMVAATAPACFCVAQEVIADNGAGSFRFFGLTDGLVIAASGSVAIGSPLVPTTAGNLDLVVATGEPVIAIGNAAAGSPTAATAAEVFFIGHLMGTFSSA